MAKSRKHSELVTVQKRLGRAVRCKVFLQEDHLTVVGRYLFRRNSCRNEERKKKKQPVNDVTRTSTQELRKNFSRYTFHPLPRLTFLPFRSMREFFLATSIFLSRSNSSSEFSSLLFSSPSSPPSVYQWPIWKSFNSRKVGVARIRNRFEIKRKKEEKKVSSKLEFASQFNMVTRWRNRWKILHATWCTFPRRNNPKL